MFRTYGLFPSTKVIYNDASVANFKDPFFNNAPVGKIYSDGMLTLKPIFEGTWRRTLVRNHSSVSIVIMLLPKLVIFEATWRHTLVRNHSSVSTVIMLRPKRVIFERTWRYTLV